ncbi:alpha/beta fold hydrolase [Micromonospora sp. PLK6-60]|uniref:alpha/beta fold hydrolase n=1 Tax=Micromonospora sp. PLK6-60 TaxID=2873383 RepID=UPI001CA6F142|nr:alpha/beta fold hydrolase [Micromonospora sp. PLK6-60]MBY8875415.1 alpha/beta fold hydrolase [Micromonospora sp. PLK6-60]
METIVLLPSLCATSRVWHRQVEALGERYAVLTPDLPGHGDNPGPFSFDRAVADLGALLDRTPGPVHLVGLSLSATVAVLTCLARPEGVRSLVLSGGVPGPVAALAVQRAVAAVTPERVIVRSAVRVLAPTITWMPPPQRQRTLTEAAEDFRTTGRRTYLAALRELARTDLRPRLPQVAVPTLVLCGSRDRVNLPGARQLAAGIPQARLEVVPDVGHLWQLERPDLFSRTVAGFVDEVAGA